VILIVLLIFATVIFSEALSAKIRQAIL